MNRSFPVSEMIASSAELEMVAVAVSTPVSAGVPLSVAVNVTV